MKKGLEAVITFHKDVIIVSMLDNHIRNILGRSLLRTFNTVIFLQFSI